MDKFGYTDENPLKLLEKYFYHLKSDLEHISTEYIASRTHESTLTKLDSNEELTQAQHELKGALENI